MKTIYRAEIFQSVNKINHISKEFKKNFIEMPKNEHSY
jgi:hypothetical protein